jgi:chromosome segregation ATPase
MEGNLQIIQSKIREFRGKKIILDFELAELYGVETKVLKRAVKRNIERFPSDFMFELRNEEVVDLRRQIGTSSWGGSRYLPFAFTEQGVSMLSSVLRSSTAIAVNIAIMRVFVRMRELAATYEELKKQMDNHLKDYDELYRIVKQIREEMNDGFSDMEQQFSDTDLQFKELYEALTALLSKPSCVERRRIGFRPDED